MAVHGKYRKPCPVCGSPVQRIVHAENETNYCAKCQTGGKLLADRSLSRLLKDDWPRSLEELEEIKRLMRLAMMAQGSVQRALELSLGRCALRTVLGYIPHSSNVFSSPPDDQWIG